MRRPGLRAIAPALGALAALCGAPLGGGEGDAALAAQSPNPRVAASLTPDSIGVGDRFTLDLWVELPSAGEVRFPAVLPLPEDIEQRDAVQVGSENDGLAWRATYTLSAWSADSLEIPPVEARIVPAGGQEFDITIVAPVVVVRSVLPSDASDLELRSARPFLRVRSFPWWILLVLAAAAIGAWLWLRRRRAPQPIAGPAGPGEAAIRDLERLRERWNAGDLTVGAFYDRYEQILRRYARATRRWAPNRSLLGLGVGGDLLGALRASLFIRFAHLRARPGGPESAIDACIAFIRSELPRDEDVAGAPATAPGPAAPAGSGGSA
ncbi:MAG: hypothetical protein R3195_03175 [Gemmatimonadota bacterium]|nr:hypothetical protein [Gemmatimonadota bacterium]